MEYSSDPSRFVDCVIGDDDTLFEAIRRSDPVLRKEILARAGVWRVQALRAGEWIIFGLLLIVPVTLMAVAYARTRGEWVDGDEQASPFSLVGKRRQAVLLFDRDFGPLSFDVSMHHDRAEITEYRGLIHWIRDACEKVLAIALVAGFTLFLARAISYGWLWATGEGWRLVFLSLDVNVAITLAGFALIIDGFIIVSTMTDAPGIGRTLDAVIVVLAGYVVMLVEAQPGIHTLISFTVGQPSWLAPLLAVVIAVLFTVRWIVRHHTLNAWLGK